jgi:protein FrlC
MAQAAFRRLAAGKALAESAGVAPWPSLHPMAVRLMAERGMTLEGHFPKPVGAVAQPLPDAVVTIGAPARERVPPSLAGATRWLHWEIADPADADGTPGSEAAFRRALAEIEERLPRLVGQLPRMTAARAWRAKPGVGTGLWSGERFEPARHLAEVARAGFGSIELCLFFGRRHFDETDPRALGELKRVLADLGLAVWSIHSPDLASLASSDPDERGAQLAALRANLRLAEDLGAKVVVSHGLIIAPRKGDPAARDAGLCRGRLASAMEELAREAAEGPACVGFENGYSGKAGYLGRDVLAALRGASRPAFGFVLDTGHARIAGDGADIVAGLGDRLVSVHLNDNDGKADAHLAPGEGAVDWGGVRRDLEAAGYAGCVMYEVMSNGRDPREVLAATMAAHRRWLSPG